MSIKLNIPTSQRIMVVADVFHYISFLCGRGPDESAYYKDTLYATIASWVRNSGIKHLPPTAFMDKDISISIGRILTDVYAALAFLRIPADLSIPAGKAYSCFAAYLCCHAGNALRSYAQYDFETTSLRGDLSHLLAGGKPRAHGTTRKRP